VICALLNYNIPCVLEMRFCPIVCYQNELPMDYA
jgi:hypothetical protein